MAFVRIIYRVQPCRSLQYEAEAEPPTVGRLDGKAKPFRSSGGTAAAEDQRKGKRFHSSGGAAEESWIPPRWQRRRFGAPK